MKTLRCGDPALLLGCEQIVFTIGDTRHRSDADIAVIPYALLRINF